MVCSGVPVPAPAGTHRWEIWAKLSVYTQKAGAQAFLEGNLLPFSIPPFSSESSSSFVGATKPPAIEKCKALEHGLFWRTPGCKSGPGFFQLSFFFKKKDELIDIYLACENSCGALEDRSPRRWNRGWGREA